MQKAHSGGSLFKQNRVPNHESNHHSIFSKRSPNRWWNFRLGLWCIPPHRPLFRPPAGPTLGLRSACPAAPSSGVHHCPASWRRGHRHRWENGHPKHRPWNLKTTVSNSKHRWGSCLTDIWTKIVLNKVFGIQKGTVSFHFDLKVFDQSLVVEPPKFRGSKHKKKQVNDCINMNLSSTPNPWFFQVSS